MKSLDSFNLITSDALQLKAASCSASPKVKVSASAFWNISDNRFRARTFISFAT